MARYLKYKKQSITQVGVDENGITITEEYFMPKMLPYSEANMEIAQAEAYNGEVTVEEVEDKETEPTTEDIINAMLGVTK